jgi:hypothetical protein
MNFHNLTDLTTRAKVQLGAIVVAMLGMQVDQVKDIVLPLVAHHPRIASLATGIFTIITFLQNPTIAKILGIFPKPGA